MKLIYTCFAALLVFVGQTQALNTFNATIKPNKYVNTALYEEIKLNAKTWTAFSPENHPFKGLTEKQIQSKMGLLSSKKSSESSLFNNVNSVMQNMGFDLTDIAKVMGHMMPKFPTHSRKVTIPASFDSRSKASWSGCIHSVRDQETCGSCWAFASAAFLEDRFCIASKKSINVRLSPQDMVDCDFSNGGCNGGFLTPSLNYLIGEGLVSESCLPYKNEMSSSCAYQCDDKYKEYRKYSCKIGSLTILTSANEIKREILINGPMMVGFTVYDDFLSYSSGIYSPTTTDVAGGHAVKIIGWDVDGSGDLFWICQNQWGTGWGDSGYFNIYANTAGLDSAAFACTPDL